MRRLLRLFTLSLTLLPTPTPAANPNEFLPFSTPNLPGRLYVPASYTPTQSYPLVLFLHGAGEAGTNNTAQVNANIDGLLAAAKSRDFFLYAPQSPSTAWGSSSLTPTPQLSRAVSMIAQAQSTYSIDPTRIYVTGLSAGGGGAWDILASYPDLFAAGIPICGTLSTTVFQPSLAHKPILAAHARNDPTVPVNNTRLMINAILNADGLPPIAFPPNPPPTDTLYSFDSDRLLYLELATGGHGIWHSLYNSPPLYDWLLSHSLPEPTTLLLLAPSLLLPPRPRRRRKPHPSHEPHTPAHRATQ